MMKPPSRIIVFESNLNMLINKVSNGEVDVKAERKLFVEVGMEQGTVEVAEGLDK